MRLRDASDGTHLRHGVGGFPLFFNARSGNTLPTSDVWSLLESECYRILPDNGADRAAAFIDQAYEFYEAAQNPRLSSRPLLYYYSFLNLAKVLLACRGVRIPVNARHGIHDARENSRNVVSLQDQAVTFDRPAQNHSLVFPEIVSALG